MHEVSIMEQTIQIALENAHQQNANKIHRLKMRLGEMSGVVPEALNFAFDVVTEGTIAEGAILEIENIPIQCYCGHCQQNFSPSDLFYECPHCHQLSTQILAGKEIELSSLEIS